MIRMMEIGGNVAGLVGLLVCFVSGALRLSGMWDVHSFDLMTLFTVGIALMVAACLFKLQAMGGNHRR